MANYLGKLSDAIFGAVDTGASIASNWMTKEAELLTEQKKSQLQLDVNAKINELSTNGKWQDWNTEITNFFQQKKSDMENPDSPYYCRNNLQAQMFDRLLNDSLVSVSNRVSQMSLQRQMQEMLAGNERAKENALVLGMSGLDYYEYANRLDQGADNFNALTPEERDLKRKQNFVIGYEKEIDNNFEAEVDSVINKDESFNSFYDRIKSKSTLNGTKEGIDTTSIDTKKKKELEARFNAKIEDMQNKNSEALSAIVQSMDQETTEEGRVKEALRGQQMMNLMKGNKLSESKRLYYADKFALAIGGGLKGSGSGSGSGTPKDSYEKLINAAPDTALQLWLDGKHGNVYDVTQTLSNALTEQWFTKPYKENYGKNEDELKEDFAQSYYGKVSSDNLTDAITSRILERFPTAKSYIDKNFTKLLNDMQKNPKEYGTATAGELANFMLDTIYSADSNYTDEDFMNAFKQHVNDCYVERIKYVELDKKGNLEKKFNANKEGDIAKAARLASEKDFVYTFNGNEIWAPGKKEALEAEGGIVDVLKNAVAGTLDIPAEDRGKVGFQYVQSKDDMTSQPVITYKNQAFEVIPNDDDKGFKLREVHTGEVIEGKLGGKGKAARAEVKTQANENAKNAHNATAEIEQKRVDEVNAIIDSTNSIPNAMKKAGGVKDIAWETGDRSNRQVYLQDTINKINIDAEAVKNNKMTKEQFYGKYGIDYTQWAGSKEKTTRFTLILKS
jgi:hypothetical protein